MGGTLFSIRDLRLPSKWREVEVIVIGEELPTKTIHVPSFPRVREFLRDKPVGTWTTGLAVTLSIHLALLSSLAFGTGRNVIRPPSKEGFAALERNQDGTELVSTLFFVQDRSIHSSDENNESAYVALDKELEQELKQSAILAAAANQGQPPQIDVATEIDANAATELGNGEEMAMLFGRYMGQIKARVERAWAYPTETSRRVFHCRAQIRQSKRGNVEEIALQNCDLDGHWQASLVHAIQLASPLSAPPSESVFTEVVTLDFKAELPNVSAATDKYRGTRVN